MSERRGGSRADSKFHRSFRGKTSGKCLSTGEPLKGEPDESRVVADRAKQAPPRPDRRAARDEKRASTVTESPRRGAGPANGSGRYRAGIPPRAFAAFFGPPMDAFKRGRRPDEGRGRPEVTAPTRAIGGGNRAKTSESASKCAGTRIERPDAFSGVSRAHAPDIRRAGVVRVRPGRRHGV